MRVKLKERRQETPDVVTFVFDLAEQSYEYQAGQFAFLELDELLFPDPRGKRRHFTISSAPSEGGIVQFTTRLRGSGFKETLRVLELGTEVALEPARGRFVLPAETDSPIVFLGGGIGVTPFRSMLRYVTDENLQHAITLLYSASTPDQIVFRRELELLPQENPNLRIVLTITSPEGNTEPWAGETGRINEAFVRKYVEDIPAALFFTCGPPPLVQATEELLRELGVEDSRIRVERFTGY